MSNFLAKNDFIKNAITFEPNKIFSFCFQIMEDKSLLFNIIAGFYMRLCISPTNKAPNRIKIDKNKNIVITFDVIKFC